MLQKLKLTTRLLLILGVSAALIYAGLNYQKLIDEWRLRGYDPPVEIVLLADNTTMKDETRRLFYINHPIIEGKDAFRQDCQGTERTIVLGCYVSNKGIFLLRVDDKRLSGIHEVTAAHEVLHAVYQRLDGQEKVEVDNMAQQALANITDKRILETIEQYRKNDPDSVPNELHSILGTEARNLTPELEQYYSRYFKDRQRIVDYSAQYQDAFTSREQRAQELLNRMNSIQKQINQADLERQARRDEINSQYQSLEARRDGADPDEFNEEVREYNAKVQEFNSLIVYRNGLAEQYNMLRDEYNALVVEEKQLIKAIDSRVPSL